MEKTLLSVLSAKLADAIDGYSLKQLARIVLGTFLAGLLSAAVVNVQVSVDSLYRFAHWHGSAPVKIVLVFLLVFNARRIVETFRAWKPAIQEETIEGIPTVELLDHLFSVRSFKRDEVEAKFGVPRYRVTELTRNLKRVGILSTGENNMSVLNPEFSRQDVAQILAGVCSAKDIEPLFRKESEHCFTARPSASEIRHRVDSLLSPAPGFTSRTLAS